MRFFNGASTVLPGNSDRHFDSACAPFSGKFPVIAFNMALGRINSEVKILISRIAGRDPLMAFQTSLRIRRAGSIIPGEHRPIPSLSCVRFVPPNTHTLLPMLCDIEKSITDGDATVS